MVNEGDKEIDKKKRKEKTGKGRRCGQDVKIRERVREKNKEKKGGGRKEGEIGIKGRRWSRKGRKKTKKREVKRKM